MFNPHDPQIEEFFQRLNAPLKRLPAQERAGAHREVRQHLDALIAAYGEAGCSNEEAVESALTRFGDPARVGRGLYAEWRRQTVPAWRTPLIGLVILFWVASFCASLFGLGHAVPVVLGALIVLPPLIAGVLFGLCLPKTASRVTFTVTSLITFGFWVSFAVAQSGTDFGRTTVWDHFWTIFALISPFAAVWYPVGLLSASLTQWLPKRRSPVSPWRFPRRQGAALPRRT